MKIAKVAFALGLSSVSAIAAPVPVNSLIALTQFEGSSQTIVTSDFTKSFFRPGAEVRDEDRGTALASLSIALALDHYARALNKFEEAPEYRVRHVIDSLLEPARLSLGESRQSIYDRLIRNWRKSCAARTDKASPCTLGIRIAAADWTTPLPDYSRPAPESARATVTEAFIAKKYAGTLPGLITDACRKGGEKLDGHFIECDPKEDSREVVRARMIKVLRANYLRDHFRETPLGLFRTRPAPRENFKHVWGEASFRLEAPPAKLADFEMRLRERLTFEYQRRTRSQIAFGLLGESLGEMGTLVLPAEVDQVVSREQLTRRTGRFALLTLDLNGLSAEALTEALDLVITRLGRETRLQRETMESAIEEIRASLKAPSHLVYRDYSAAHSVIFRAPSDAVEAQMQSRLFRREIEGFSGPELTGTEHTYFVDSSAQKLTILALIEEDFRGTQNVSPGDARIDYELVSREALSKKLDKKLLKVFDRLIDRSDLILKNPKTVMGRTQAPSTGEVRKWMKSSLRKKLTDAKALSELQEHIFSSPLQLKRMRSPETKTNVGGPLPRLGEFLGNFFPSR